MDEKGKHHDATQRPKFAFNAPNHGERTANCNRGIRCNGSGVWRFENGVNIAFNDGMNAVVDDEDDGIPQEKEANGIHFH